MRRCGWINVLILHWIRAPREWKLTRMVQAARQSTWYRPIWSVPCPPPPSIRGPPRSSTSGIFTRIPYLSYQRYTSGFSQKCTRLSSLLSVLDPEASIIASSSQSIYPQVPGKENKRQGAKLKLPESAATAEQMTPGRIQMPAGAVTHLNSDSYICGKISVFEFFCANICK